MTRRRVILSGLMVAIACSVCPVAVQADPGTRFLGPNAVFAAVVRPQKVWRSELAKALPTELIEIEAREQLGLLPGEIVSVMMLLGMPEEEGGQPQFGMVVRTSRAVKLEELFPAMQADGELKLAEHPLTGKPYLQAVGFSLGLGDDTTVVMASTESFDNLMHQGQNGVTGELAELVKRGGDKGEIQAYLAIDPMRELAEATAEAFPLEIFAPEIASVGSLPSQLRYAELFIDMTTDQSGLTLKLTGRDHVTAEGLEKNLRKLIEYGASLSSQMLETGELSEARKAALAKYQARMIQATFETLEPTRNGEEVTVSTVGKPNNQLQWLVGSAMTALVPIMQQANPPRAEITKRNLQQLAIAMHNFHDTYNQFPPLEQPNRQNSKFSWRVHLLPYIEQAQLYNQFKLDEPWDSEHNLKVAEKMPETYMSFGSPELFAEGKTRFVRPVGKGLPGSVEGRLHFASILDGTSNTIMFVEAPADKAVFWTKPDDLEIDMDNPIGTLANPDGESFSAAFYDGSVKTISNTIENRVLELYLMHNDGKPVPFPE